MWEWCMLVILLFKCWRMKSRLSLAVSLPWGIREKYSDVVEGWRGVKKKVWDSGDKIVFSSNIEY